MGYVSKSQVFATAICTPFEKLRGLKCVTVCYLNILILYLSDETDAHIE